MQFKELGLSEELLSAVKSMGFDEMTEIQEKSIPVIMKGLDIIGRSNTGTGKTAAFGIPVIEKILQNDSDFIQTLILCPTRELAQQACEEIKKFSKYKNWVKPLKCCKWDFVKILKIFCNIFLKNAKLYFFPQQCLLKFWLSHINIKIILF